MPEIEASEDSLEVEPSATEFHFDGTRLVTQRKVPTVHIEKPKEA